VGPEQADDAVVYMLSPDRALVLTADFITPLCDDPHLWGRIAAANCLSDVYAMGGRPMVAINLAGVPESRLPLDVLEQVLLGGRAKAAEAGVCVAGGHTIASPEPFYGMAVVGDVHPDRVLRNAGARPGDALVLTKPLGVGIVVTAMMAGIADEATVAAAMSVAERLNRRASEAMVRHGAHAATDVTGFSLVGHGHEMAAAGRVGLRLRFADLPILPGALDYAAQWCLPAGMMRNREYYSQWSNLDDLSAEQAAVVCDPQTSGGLLIALAPEAAAAAIEDLRAQGEDAWVVGDVHEAQPGAVLFS